MATTTTTSPTTNHLETIDYKPPAQPSTSTLDEMKDEKKTEDEPALAAETNTTNAIDGDHHHPEDHEEGGDDVDLYHQEEEWDEGGKSHCGYSDTIHATLMSVGQQVHKVVGEPSPRVEAELKAVGNWFQEASYAARDLFGGGSKHPDGTETSTGLREDALDAVRTLFGNKKMKEEEEHNDNEDKKEDDTKPTTEESTTTDDKKEDDNKEETTQPVEPTPTGTSV